jgi:poly-gamma-glutamate synthesis protein (capsule biosynthesis protein)
MHSRPKTFSVSIAALALAAACVRTSVAPPPEAPPPRDEPAPAIEQPVPAAPESPPVVDAGPVAKETDRFTMLAVGDIQLGRTIFAEMVDRDDFTYPVASTAKRLRAADITVGNLESQIFDGCPLLEVGMRLCAGPRALQSIDAAGFDVLTVANNHATNFGKGSLAQSVELLEQNGIQVAGFGKQIPVVERNGTRIAFVGWSPVNVKLPLKRIANQIRRAKEKADLVFAFVHWGMEYETTPSRAQTNLADFIASKGVDLIIGAHPHVVQPMEKVRDTLVAYSLGNFVFDWMQGVATRGAVGEFVIEDGAISSSRLIPIQLDDYGAPHFTDETTAQ